MAAPPDSAFADVPAVRPLRQEGARRGCGQSAAMAHAAEAHGRRDAARFDPVRHGKLDSSIGRSEFRAAEEEGTRCFDLCKPWTTTVPTCGSRPSIVSLSAAENGSCWIASIAPIRRSRRRSARSPNTPVQALTLLNNDFVLKQAGFLAERIGSKDPDRSRLRLAVWPRADRSANARSGHSSYRSNPWQPTAGCCSTRMSLSMSRKLSRRELLWEAGGGLAGIALAHMLAGEALLRPITTQRPRTSSWSSCPADSAPSIRSTTSPRSRNITARNARREHDHSVLRQARHGDEVALDFRSVRPSRVSGSAISSAPGAVCRRCDLRSLDGGAEQRARSRALSDVDGLHLSGLPVDWLLGQLRLGRENENLPSFVVLPDRRGLPPCGVANWGNGFLPAAHQGVIFGDRATPIADLHPPARSSVRAAGRQVTICSAPINRRAHEASSGRRRSRRPHQELTNSPRGCR